MVQVQSYIDYAKARFNMVHGLLRPNLVVRPDIVDAFLSIPREQFMPEQFKNVSYIDSDLSFGKGRFQLCPLTFARMVQASDLQEDDVVLDIGCLNGYSSAILGKLAGSVIGIDSEFEYLSEATEMLSKLEVLNTVFHYAEIEKGFSEGAPYSLILIQGQVNHVPEMILNQLIENGRLLAIVSKDKHQGVLRLYQKCNGIIAWRDLFDLTAKPLPGFEEKKGFVF